MEKIQNQWSIHVEFAVILVTLIGGIYTQGSRTDRLYEMYCDMQKEMKEMNEKHHQEMKEIYKHWST